MGAEREESHRAERAVGLVVFLNFVVVFRLYTGQRIEIAVPRAFPPDSKTPNAATAPLRPILGAPVNSQRAGNTQRRCVGAKPTVGHRGSCCGGNVGIRLAEISRMFRREPTEAGYLLLDFHPGAADRQVANNVESQGGIKVHNRHQRGMQRHRNMLIEQRRVCECHRLG